MLALALAVLFHTAHTVALVAAVTVAVNAAPGPSVPTVHVRICGLVALMLQLGVTVAHVTPPLFGKVSVITTLFAVPCPVLVTTMVNVAVSPALIAGAPTSGDFAIASTGARHVI